MPLVRDLKAQFRKRLKDSSHVDMAVAWATSGWALDCLADAVGKHKIQVRAIVGTYGNATDPDALEVLNALDLGELRLDSNRSRLFHPKVYVFQGGKREVAWIGSTNFTRAGFEKNEEAVFETHDVDTVISWFERLWEDCGPLPPHAIEDYRKRWVRNPPSRSLAGLTGAMNPCDIDRLEFFGQARDWSGFVRAVELCQAWWIDYWRERDENCKYLPYRDGRSWMHTIDKGRSVARKRDWSQLSQNEASILLGLYHDDRLDSGLLGDMQRARDACNRFLEDRTVRRRIGRVVDRVIRAHADTFPNVAIEAIEEIRKEKKGGFGLGIATRLLALARPDRIVSLNGRSKEQLKKAFPEAKGLSTSNRYGQLLDALYRKGWYDVAKPSDAFERKLWSMRAALLDCFVYVP